LFAPLSAAVSLALLVSGCGGVGGASATPSGAPTLTVVTGVYPLAQAVSEIGQGRVNVIDLAPAGANPAALTLTPAQINQAHAAGVVVEVGDGYQPALAAATAGQANVVSLLPALGGSDPDVWLDPTLMQKAAKLIGAAMIKADPAGKSNIANGEADFNDELESISIDYEQTLSDCPDNTIVTPDNAFTRTAGQFGFTDLVVGASNTPSAAEVAAAAKAIRNTDAVTVFSEPWTANAVALDAAAADHVKVRSIDTLAGPPPGGWPSGTTYFDLIEQDLGSIKDALQCPEMGDQ
jgi:zinc transport system substrate-binding protein